GKTRPTLPGNYPPAPPPARAVRVADRPRGRAQRPQLHPELEPVSRRANPAVPAPARGRPAPQAAHRRGARRAPRQDLQGAAALGRGAVRAVVPGRGCERGTGACAHDAAGRGAVGPRRGCGLRGGDGRGSARCAGAEDFGGGIFLTQPTLDARWGVGLLVEYLDRWFGMMLNDYVT
ncbi:hypothetical protein BO82DRAFT_422482, partial [Aspergillus uvarum CBS 121591]